MAKVTTALLALNRVTTILVEGRSSLWLLTFRMRVDKGTSFPRAFVGNLNT